MDNPPPPQSDISIPIAWQPSAGGGKGLGEGRSEETSAGVTGGGRWCCREAQMTQEAAARGNHGASAK